MHTLFYCYCLFCPISILLHTLNSTLYFVLYRIEDNRELSKDVFKELNVLYKTTKANFQVKCSSLPQTKQTISLVSMFLLNLL